MTKDDNFFVETSYELTGLIWQPMTPDMLERHPNASIIQTAGEAYFHPGHWEQRDGPMTKPYRKIPQRVMDHGAEIAPLVRPDVFTHDQDGMELGTCPSCSRYLISCKAPCPKCGTLLPGRP